MTRKTLLMALIYVSLMSLFGGRNGVVVALVVLAAWRVGVPRPAFWAAAALLMAAAPVALMAQGLPGTPVVGSDFGASHLVAHALVGLSLALAGFAGMWEVTERGRGPEAAGDDGGSA